MNSNVDTQTFNFRPLKSWPTGWPSFRYGPWLIAGWQEESSSLDDVTGSIDLSRNCPNIADLPKVIAQTYPHLTMAELSRLRACCHSHSTWNFNGASISGENLFVGICRHSLGNFSAHHDELLDILGLTPQNFQDWTSSRDLQTRELTILKLLQNTDFNDARLLEFFDFFAEMQLSRNQGARILELWVELFLMKRSPALIKGPDLWLTALEAARNPHSTQILASKEDQKLELPWSKAVRAKSVREGDKTGYEIQFRFFNELDLKHRIENLQRVHAKLLLNQQMTSEARVCKSDAFSATPENTVHDAN